MNFQATQGGEPASYHVCYDRMGAAVQPSLLYNQPPLDQGVTHRRGMQPRDAMNVGQYLGAAPGARDGDSDEHFIKLLG
jgi:hypothetical protein